MSVKEATCFPCMGQKPETVEDKLEPQLWDRHKHLPGDSAARKRADSEAQEVVLFSGTEGLYGCFSTHYHAEIFLGGQKWPTVEHYVQAQKFPDNQELRDRIRFSATAAEAKALGRRRDAPMRKDWETVRDKYMKGANEAKIFQHYAIREMLLETGNKQIVYHEYTEEYWGDGRNGSGSNMLGKLLMELRAQMRQPIQRSGLSSW